MAFFLCMAALGFILVVICVMVGLAAADSSHEIRSIPVGGIPEYDEADDAEMGGA